MQRKTLLTSVALWLATVGAADAGDDITMQGLDDVSDVSRVVAAVDLELRARDADAKNARKASRSDSATPSVSIVGSPPEPVPKSEQIQTVLDREEESEGEIEDFDVPEDITVPEPTEDDEEE